MQNHFKGPKLIKKSARNPRTLDLITLLVKDYTDINSVRRAKESVPIISFSHKIQDSRERVKNKRKWYLKTFSKKIEDLLAFHCYFSFRQLAWPAAKLTDYGEIPS